jgi:hypothetical protein
MRHKKIKIQMNNSIKLTINVNLKIFCENSPRIIAASSADPAVFDLDVFGEKE